MMASVSTSPTLDEPPLPEFSRATLLLENSTKTIRRDNDLFVDLVDLSNDSGAAKTNETQPTPARKRRNTSPDSSGIRNAMLFALSFIISLPAPSAPSYLVPTY